MVRSTRLRTIAISCALSCAVAAPAVAAQDGQGPSTTEPPSSTTSTSSLPPSTGPTTSTSSTVPPGPPTTVYLPPVPPELAADPRLPYLVDPGPADGIDVPLAQLPFDPRSVSVLPERVVAAREALDAAQLALVSLQEEIAGRSRSVADLSERVRALDGDVRAAVQEAALARRKLADHAVTAYMVGPVEEQLALLRGADFVDMGVAKSYVDVVADTRERLVREYEQKRRGLDRDHAQLAAALGEGESALAALGDDLPAAFLTVLGASRELAAYEAGAHAYIDGFVFPVAGEVEFIDSWGYPRMMGTPSAHWHQGTDIFAPAGTPLVAAENGVLARIGTGTLGGNKLWVVGESGNEYYYAHLSAFAEGIGDGKVVKAGEVVGFVGDTGNARGTSPHLHFEIHPNGIGPANPYPLLKAAYGARPVARAVAPTTTAPPPPTGG